MSIIWIIAIIAFLALILVKDKQIKKTSEYKGALQNSKKPPKKLYIKRWWTWVILIFLSVATFTAVSIEIDNADKANKAQIAKSSSKKIDKKENKKAEPKKKLSKSNKNKNKKAKKVKKADDKKQKERDIKDSQKNMSDELNDIPIVKDYVIKIKYRGDGYADISVADSFTSLSQREKNSVAKKVNNFVTSYAEDFEMSQDPYCFLTFMYKGKLVGHSKQLSHNEYKWQK